MFMHTIIAPEPKFIKLTPFRYILKQNIIYSQIYNILLISFLNGYVIE